MKAFSLKLRELIEGPTDPLNPNPISSKRVFFLIALSVAIIATFTIKDSVLVGVWLGAATAVAGLTAISKT